MKTRLALILALIWAVAGCQHAARLPTTRQVIESKADLWGDAALRQPGGASYEFFEKLSPPLRYVDADFRVYPIVLSAPGATIKARLVADGSAINALARAPIWKNEEGTPVHILVGPRRSAFGADPSRLRGPRYVDGYLPIVQLDYHDGGDDYGEEVFAPVDSDDANVGAVCVRFTFPGVDRGRIEIHFESAASLITAEPADKLSPRGLLIKNSASQTFAACDDQWQWNPSRNSLVSKSKHSKMTSVKIFTARLDSSASLAPYAGDYLQKRSDCVRDWNALLSHGMTIETPEPIVNNAWRALIIGTNMIRSGVHLNYSASNQYARQYANESGDTMRSMLLWGQTEVARRSIEPLFVYRRPHIEFHDAAFKLELLADYYFITHDVALINELRPLWQREVDLILSSRDKSTGLLSREKYCSDIDTPVRSLNANANCWRGLRDLSVVLEEIGAHDESQKLASVAAEYRGQILAAMRKAIVRTVDPPWVPVALDGEEPPANPITATRLGSYWNLVVPCVLWSGVFPIDSEPADDILHTIQRNGGLCMGLTRVQSGRLAGWVNPQNIDDLYGIRYSLALLRRDEVDRELVSFYAKLAQGMTRDTFIGCETSGIEPIDGEPPCGSGREMGLPPNSTANASFLLQLRYLLVQDWDTDDDGRADALQLAFATPRRWLDDGKRIVVTNAPTAFGPVSFRIESNANSVVAQLELPAKAPKTTRLRLRLPDAKHIASISAGKLEADGETIDLTGLTGHVSLTATIAK